MFVVYLFLGFMFFMGFFLVFYSNFGKIAGWLTDFILRCLLDDEL